MDSDELNRAVQKLNEAKAISEWHFRDAVEELLEEYAEAQRGTAPWE